MDTCLTKYSLHQSPPLSHPQKSHNWHTTILLHPYHVPNAINPQRTKYTQHSPSYYNGVSPAPGIPCLYRNRTSVITFTRPCLCVLSRATLIQSTSPYDVLTIHFNIIPYTRLRLQSCLFPSRFFPFKIPHIFRWPCFLHVQPIPFSAVS
jgi:hypothetical protein